MKVVHSVTNWILSCTNGSCTIKDNFSIQSSGLIKALYILIPGRAVQSNPTSTEKQPVINARKLFLHKYPQLQFTTDYIAHFMYYFE